ncbi:MAG TPA: Asp23/Gls24 family envelope stress response protein, partial [Nakamurella sp.]
RAALRYPGRARVCHPEDCGEKGCEDFLRAVSKQVTSRVAGLAPGPSVSEGACLMSQSATPEVTENPANGRQMVSPAARDRLATGEGQITVAENVVQKIAGKACREVDGVHAMGTGGTRAFGAVRERIPGSTGPNVAQGVGVEVGEKEAAIDLDIVVDYGVSIAELGRSIQRNVKQSVERMTGLRVVEVNIAVDDVYLPSDDDQDTQPARVS